MSRSKERAGRFLALAVLAIGSTGCASDPANDPSTYLRMHSVALSADGRRLAFDYCRTSHCGMGILDIETDAIRLIDNPEGFQMDSPTFSNDGTKLAFSLTCRCSRDDPGAFDSHIAIYELQTGRQYPLTINPKDNRRESRLYPVFVPNSDDVLFLSKPVLFLGGKAMRAGSPSEFVIVSARDGTQRVAASVKDLKFYSIDRPTFLNADTIAFSALVWDGDISAKFGLPEWGTSKLEQHGGGLPYATFQVRFGSEVRLSSLMHDPPANAVGYVSASRNGARVVFISPTPVRRKQPFAQLDVFMAEGGRVEQISDLAASPHDANISLDGSRVAVLNNLGRSADELYVIDVETRMTRHLPLRERLLQMTPP